jgi:hypothetical protein
MQLVFSFDQAMKVNMRQFTWENSYVIATFTV